jgi:hypothetical protein
MRKMNILHSWNHSTYNSSNDLVSEFKDDYLLQQKAAACAGLFGSIYICREASSLIKLNKCAEQNRPINQNASFDHNLI